MFNTLNSTIRSIIIGLLFAVLFVPLVVATNLYFPYITGKAFLFRALIDVALLFYVFLIVRDRSYLPKSSVLTWCILAFLGVMGIATLTSVDPVRSFWSNYERMEGYVTLLYLGAYFLLLSSVFTKRVWSAFFHTTLFVSVAVGITGFLDIINGTVSGDRIAGALGNSSYLGVYALLHIFIAALFFLRRIESSSEKKESLSMYIPWLVAYVFFFLYNIIVLYQTGTRGSFVGLVVGSFITAILLAIINRKNKVVRYTSIGVFAAVVLIVIVLGAAKNTAFIQKHDLLARFSSLITPNVVSVVQNQGYARTVLWSIAYKGFTEHPMLGWGQDNFVYVFAKDYDPRMWNQEQWFDRSHNVFFDWLIAGGLLGLLSYLSLFAGILYLLWLKKGGHDHTAAPEWSATERAVLTGLLAAYFVHNLFVFDNLSSYLLFFALLGYVHTRSLSTHPHHKALGTGAPLISDQVAGSTIAGGVAILIIIAFYYSVYNPYQASASMLSALQNDQYITAVEKQSATSSGAIANSTSKVILSQFEDAISRYTFGTEEVRERLSDVALDMIGNTSVDRETAAAFDKLVNEQYALQLAQTPNDPRYFEFYGVYKSRLGDYDNAIKYLSQALLLSPNKQSFIIQLAQVYAAKGDYASALTNFKQAYEEDTANTSARNYYAATLVYSGDVKGANALILGTDAMSDPTVIQAYADTKNFNEIISYLKQQIAKAPNNPQLHVSLAAGYMQIGDRTDAIAELRAAIKLAPAFETQGNMLIEQIQAGKNPIGSSK